MRDGILERLATGFGGREPATDAAIVSFVERRGIALPEDYLRFLRLKNGGEGPIGPKSYLVLWGIHEIADNNAAYEVDQYAPNLCLFGCDGAAEAYGFDTAAGMAVVMVPFMDIGEAKMVRTIAPTFTRFLEVLAGG